MDTEAIDIIEELLKGAEQLYLLAYTQRLFLTDLYGSEWESHVASVQAELAPYVAGLFAPLRDAVDINPSGSYPLVRWHRVVHRLVEGVTPPTA